MTIKKKILFGYCVALLLMSLVVTWAIINLVTLGKASDAILSENYRSIIASENMVNSLERQDSGILLMLLQESDLGVTQFKENEMAFTGWLYRAKDNITIKGEAGLLLSIEKDYTTYCREFSDIESTRGTSSQSSMFTRYLEELLPVFLKIRLACARLRDLNENTMYAASEKARFTSQWAIWSTSLVSAGALIFALLFSSLLAERIVRPIRRFIDASRQISGGDYSVKLQINNDELGNLAGEFNKMASQLASFHEINIDRIVAEKNKAEAILSCIEDGLVIFDTELNVIGINPAARQMLSIQSVEDPCVQCRDIIADTNIWDIVRNTFETGESSVIPDEKRIITIPREHSSSQYYFSVAKIKGRDGSISGMILLLRDITRLREVERMKSDFIMAASHELRTPLTSLGMSIELLHEHITDRLEEKDKDLLQAAQEEVQRMKALVSDLLDLSKIESGKIELEFASMSIIDLFNHIQMIFKNQIDINSIDFSVIFPDNSPKIIADSNKITWVLTNLVSNALRYVNKGGHIVVSAVHIGEYIYFSVRDDGQGIPIEYQAKIFQKFTQIEGRKAGGIGLGLAICREIVKAHSGSIWVESLPGQGSTFTFTLPIAK